ncbi:MAG TPA: DUF5134 domain-containing protein, partial [Pseudonocardia sp.]
MIHEPVLRWIFTFAVAAAGALYLYRGTREGAATHRVTGVLHLITCAGMIAMAWPAAMNLGRMPQILLYGFAAAWFAGLLAFDVGGRRNASLAYHAAMPSAMMWMVLVMPTVMRGGFPTARVATEHTGMAVHNAAMTTSAPLHVVAATALLLTAAFAVAGVFWLARAFGA